MLQALVQTGFQNWKKALDTFKKHQDKEYHKKAFEDAENFRLIFENKKKTM